MTATLGNTIGAVFIGTIFAAMLYGVTNLQVFHYYQHYPNDWRVQKISVALLWFLDTLHMSLTIAAVYHYTIDSFWDLPAIRLVVWSFKAQITVNVIIILVVQTLYAVRIWKLGRHHQRIWPIMVAIIVAIGYGIGITAVINTYSMTTFAEKKITWVWVIYADFVATIVADVAIAMAICFYLIKNKSGFSRTNTKVAMIIRIILISGVLTSACTVAAFICYLAMPDNLVFFAIEFLLTKLYINSFMALLNARQSPHDTNTSPGNSANITKIMDIRRTTSSHVTTSGPSDVDVNKDIMQLTPLGKYRHDFESGVGLEEVKRSGELNRNYLIIGDNSTHCNPPRLRNENDSV